MADKISTLILTVDLECCRCYKEIREVLAKFLEIKRLIFDVKNNKVIVSGPFDPEKLKRKLSKACKYIKDIQIKPPEQPKPAPSPKPAVPEKPGPPPGIPAGPSPKSDHPTVQDTNPRPETPKRSGKKDSNKKDSDKWSKKSEP